MQMYTAPVPRLGSVWGGTIPARLMFVHQGVDFLFLRKDFCIYNTERVHLKNNTNCNRGANIYGSEMAFMTQRYITPVNEKI